MSRPSYKLHLTYIHVPVLLGYELQDFTILSGPYSSFLLSSKTKGSPNDMGFLWDKKVDFGITAGLRHQTGSGLNIDLRYDHGLSPISELIFTDEQGNLIEVVNDRNRSFQLSVGYRLSK